jgi:hypothetical protein
MAWKLGVIGGMGEEGFGAHRESLGPRYRRQVDLGPSNLARRVVTVGEGKPQALQPAELGRDRVRVAREAVGEVAGRGRGRPRVDGVRPWEAAGVSRRTWERRRKERGDG